jgi:hypothetical protein
MALAMGTGGLSRPCILGVAVALLYGAAAFCLAIQDAVTLAVVVPVLGTDYLDL